MPEPEDYGTYDVGSSGGGSSYTGPSTPPFRIPVDDCRYKEWMNLPTTMKRDSLLLCQTRFEQSEKDTLIALGNRLLVKTTDTTWSNETARQHCAQMRFWFNAMLTDTSGTFGKGNGDTTHRTDTAHFGQSSPDLGDGVGHVDPKLIIQQLGTSGLAKLAADRKLLMVTIHETTHAYGAKNHGTQEQYPWYVSPYFIRINYPGESNQCIK